MNWTKQQDQAIHSKPCTLLVSAAAGSGKTAVLTQRIAEKIADPAQELTVDNVVVVTFTKAAAGELKERLHQKLSQAAALDGNSRRLAAQLAALPTARISTIHSFCFTLIRENASLLGLSPTVKIADPVRAGSLLKDSVQKVLRAYYAEEPHTAPHGYADFLLLLELFGVSGNDGDFAEYLTQLYGEIRSYPAPETILPDACDALERQLLSCEQNQQSLYQCECFAPLLQSLREDLILSAEKLEKALELTRTIPAMSEKSLSVLEGELAHARFCRDCPLPQLPETLKTWESTGRFNFPKDPGDPAVADKIRQLRKEGRALLTEAIETVEGYREEEILPQLRTTLGLCRTVSALLTDLDREYSRRKEEEALLDYADLEQFCAKLLCQDLRYTPEGIQFEKTPAALRISQEICELYVDEYQDTNRIQDVIFRAACRPGRMFMVGDPKQSVYGFRGARPEIFIGYKSSFAPYAPEEEATEQKLMLSNNFRCDRTVIDFTNRIFTLLMNTDPKAPLYTPEDQLIFTKQEDSALPVELLLADKEEAEEDEELFDDPEALLIAQRIRALMQEGILTEKKTLLQYGDVAVLARNSKILACVRRALIRQGIPCTEDADDSFFASAEILFFRSLLRIVDNPFDDISLASALNSPVFAFSPDELLAIRKHAPSLSFHRAAHRYAEENEKLQSFFQTLKTFRQYARGHSLYELVLYVLEQTDTENVYAACAQALRVHKNVRTLLDLAAECDRAGGSDLSVFQDWLDAQSAKSSNTENASSNAVRLMTIHHSKGLEFPCVFVAGLHTRFNNKEFTRPALFDPQYGVAFRVFDESGLAKVKTPLFSSVVLRKKKEQLEEEKRLLYVALTRARQKLILTAKSVARTLASKCSYDPAAEAPSLARKASSFLDLILAGLATEPLLSQALEEYQRTDCATRVCAPHLCIHVLPPSACQGEGSPIELFPPEEAPLSPATLSWDEQELREMLEFEYPFATLSQIPKKLSVSGLAPVTDASAEPVVARKLSQLFQGEKGGAFAGTAAHQFMQFCDFEKAATNCQEEAQRLLQLGFLSQEQYRVLRYDRLQRFFRSSLYAALSQSKVVHRELRFNVFLPANQLIPQSTDKEILLQGVIDCFFENPDGSYTLFDFKTDHAVGEEGRALLRERHSRQLQIYRLAVEKMTGKAVSNVYIWSFSLGEALEVEP